MLPTAPESDARANLRDLSRINRWLGGYGVMKREIRRWRSSQEPFLLLDIGSGNGDFARYLQQAFPRARLVSCDLKLLHLRDAPWPKLVADVRDLPFRERSFDVVTCNLLLHHFTDPEIVRLLRELAKLSRGQLLVNDLERHPLAYAFLPATLFLFDWHPITIHDGMRSVAAGFRPAELLALAQQAGLTHVCVRRHLPWFRLSLCGIPPASSRLGQNGPAELD